MVSSDQTKVLPPTRGASKSKLGSAYRNLFASSSQLLACFEHRWVTWVSVARSRRSMRFFTQAELVLMTVGLIRI